MRRLPNIKHMLKDLNIPHVTNNEAVYLDLITEQPLEHGYNGEFRYNPGDLVIWEDDRVDFLFDTRTLIEVRSEKLFKSCLPWVTWS